MRVVARLADSSFDEILAKIETDVEAPALAAKNVAPDSEIPPFLPFCSP